MDFEVMLRTSGGVHACAGGSIEEQGIYKSSLANFANSCKVGQMTSKIFKIPSF